MISARKFTVGLLLTAAASLAHAASVATFTCNTTNGPFTLNLSHFDIGVSDSSNSGTTQTGRPALNPLIVHASLGSFGTLFFAASAGTVLSSCLLTTQQSNGASIQFALKSVVVTSVTAVASAATDVSQRAAYTKALLTYTALQVTDPGTGTDDGGASEGGGWHVGAAPMS